jgi:predicted Na+-dependent transporter
LSLLNAILGFLGRYAPQAMAAGVFVGLALPELAHLLRPLLTGAVWGLLFMAMLRIEWGALVERMRRPVLVVALLLWMLIATPVLVALILTAFDLRPGLEAAVILTAASSSLFSTPALGVMFGLDGALLLIVLVFGTLLVPLTLPLVALTLLGFDIGADPVAMMARMVMLVASAALIAIITRRVFGEARVARAAPLMDGVSVILLIGFAIAIMDGITARLTGDPAYIGLVAALSFAVYIGMMAMSYGVFLLAMPGVGRRAALSAGFVSGTRNLAIILAVLPASVDPDLPLFFAVGQFPIYILPMVLKPVFRRLLR